MRFTIKDVCFLSIFTLSSTAAIGQDTVSEESLFVPDNAFLDTSILFTPDAKERRQELRGSFGWPTYQEGHINGVYYRFDPDGYARFSDDPRLDQDFFEVVCEPGGKKCAATKSALVIAPKDESNLTIHFEGIHNSDQIYVVHGANLTEVQNLPGTTLSIEDEALLGSGEELIFQRRGLEFGRISLVGFRAAASFTKWIANGQDPLYLPTSTPAGTIDDARRQFDLAGSRNSIRSFGSWQDQGSRQEEVAIRRNNSSDVLSENSLQIAELKGEIRALYHFVRGREGDAAMKRQKETIEHLSAERISENTEVASIHPLRPTKRYTSNTLEMETNHARLQESGNQIIESDGNHQDADGPMQGQKFAEKLRYLIDEMGFDVDTALAILEHANQISDPVSVDLNLAGSAYDENQNPAIDNIAEIAPKLSEPIELSTKNKGADQEFVLLSEYFKSAP